MWYLDAMGIFPRGRLIGPFVALALLVTASLSGCRRDEAQPFRPVAATSLPSSANANASPLPTPIPTPSPKPGPAAATPPSANPAASVATASPSSSAPTASATPAQASSAGTSTASGCGRKVESPPRGVDHTTTSGRTFHVWAPRGYDGKTKLPVVLVFHGWYANGTAFQSWFKMEDHVDDKAIVVYPDSQGPTWALSGDKDTSFVAKMIADVEAAYCIDRSKVFAFGFSYGGKFTHNLGCTHPELVKAISVGDGSLGGGLTKCGNLPVLVTHRTRDDDEKFDWGKSAAEAWAGVNGCSKETTASPLEHGCLAYKSCKPGAPVTFCEDTYFNAAWPHDWNHTVREEYRTLTWRWFASLP